MGKFTFKKEPRETGLAAVANPYPATRVKRNGRWVATIYPPSRWRQDSKWRVSLKVNDAGSGAGWAWVTLGNRFDTEPAAREWLCQRQAEIEARYELCETADD